MRPDLINLFNVNPPPDELLERLFRNRARELALALDGLASRSTANEILAVHGETRSGKSHFVRVLLKKLPGREASWRTFTIMANHRGSVRPVLEDIYDHLWKVLPLVRDKIAHVQHKAFDAFVVDQDRRRPLLHGEQAEQTHESNTGSADVVEGAVGLRASVIDGRITDRREERRGEADRVTTRPPSDAQLVEWIRDVLDALHQFEPGRPVLLFVDDLDQLEQRKTTDATVCAELIQRLLSLAVHPHALVLTTVRTAYFNRQHKEFNHFVQLPFLDEGTLRDIYETHVRELHDGKPVLDAEALALVARESRGQVGMFLKTCRDLLQWGYGRLPVTAAGVSEFVAHKLYEFKNTPECVAYLPDIEKALREAHLSVKLEGDLHHTPLLYTVLTPVPSQPDRYLINPLWAEALRRGRLSPP